ncbi:MAG: hypothetical protein JWO66_1517 [Candidatus Eremiobacteraeota bacterium]|nr:hypothetical protein [Candidatus Eremiobacteraeota bacterium]
MDAGVSLPEELRGPFDPNRAADDRQALWERWELAQWIAATRSRGLAFLTLDTEVQRRLIAAIDDRLPLSA